VSPRSKARVCSSPDCGQIAPAGGLCPDCKRQEWREIDKRRPAASQRGYGPRWRRIRARFLRENPICVDCGAPATVADHDPLSRVELVARGVSDPDHPRNLRPRCASCHNRRTALEDGGFGRAKGSA
jgi:5-methylcytosine-specific restriction endonuclease McrA